MKTVPPPATLSSASLRPVAWLAALTLAGWLAGARWPGLLLSMGIADHRTAYLDCYAILAALDGVRAGIDVHATNPLDPLFRAHVYSDWWLGLRWFGLTRADNILVGTAWVLAFGLVAWFTARPRRLSETLWLAVILISPPFLLAVKRGNNDLVVFVLLAGCGLAATAGSWWRPTLALACLILATGLKYFPAPAALAFLWIRPVRKMPALLILGFALVAFTLASVWGQLDRARFFVGSGVYTMGAPLLWRDLGGENLAAGIPTAMLIAVVALALVATRITTGLAHEGEPAERMRAAIGCIALLACFSAGMNFAYRWIFVVWPAIWWWRRAADAGIPARQRRAAGAACALVAVCLWSDGLFCLAVNELPTVTKERLTHLEYLLRLCVQPLTWVLMFLLAGWLLEAGLVSVREWWNTRLETSRT